MAALGWKRRKHRMGVRSLRHSEVSGVQDGHAGAHPALQMPGITYLNSKLGGSLMVPYTLPIIQEFDVGSCNPLLPGVCIKNLAELGGRLHLQS